MDHGVPSTLLGFDNSRASQSNNSGCVGMAPALPKSLPVETIPVPKTCCQIRFAMTLAVNGFSLSTTHSAKRALRACPLRSFSIPKSP